VALEGSAVGFIAESLAETQREMQFWRIR